MICRYELLMRKQKIMEQIQQNLREKWKKIPATNKQKHLLKKLEMSFEPEISKGDAFFLLSKRLNGGSHACS
jgi:uncharacterized protein YjcR